MSFGIIISVKSPKKVNNKIKMKYFSLKLDDFGLTYFGSCFKVILSLTPNHHPKRLDLARSPELGQMKVIAILRKKNTFHL